MFCYRIWVQLVNNLSYWLTANIVNGCKKTTTKKLISFKNLQAKVLHHNLYFIFLDQEWNDSFVVKMKGMEIKTKWDLSLSAVHWFNLTHTINRAVFSPTHSEVNVTARVMVKGEYWWACGGGLRWRATCLFKLCDCTIGDVTIFPTKCWLLVGKADW